MPLIDPIGTLRASPASMTQRDASQPGWQGVFRPGAGNGYYAPFRPDPASVLAAGGDFADGVIAYEGNWLGGETFVSFDKKAVALLTAQGQSARLL